MKAIMLLLITTFFVATIGCKSDSSKQIKEPDTPTSGEITIASDASFSPLINEELNTFSLIYPEAKIHIQFLPEQEVIKSFLDNKVPLALIPRTLSADEKNYFEQEKIPVQQIKIGTDALAFVVNRENPDSNLTFQQVKDILSGKITRWKEIDSHSLLDSLVLVFDNRHSSTIRYLQTEVISDAALTRRAFAADSEAMIKNYVEQNRSAIGVVDVSRISDTREGDVQAFLQSIRVVAVSQEDSLNNPVFYKPSRYNILYGKYPFLRDLYLILREGHMGLGTGFANYVMSEQGQLIIHHFGLVAAKQPIRIIELKNEF